MPGEGEIVDATGYATAAAAADGLPVAAGGEVDDSAALGGVDHVDVGGVGGLAGGPGPGGREGDVAVEVDVGVGCFAEDGVVEEW